MTSALAALADMTPGLAVPAASSQRVFRVVLEALSRPGTVQRLPAGALAGLHETPSPGPCSAALMLTLLDAETSLHIAPPLHGEPLCAWLRFHTGVRLAPQPSTADFVLSSSASADPALWRTLRLGSDEVPQQGATWLVEVPALSAPGQLGAGALRCTGPGIRDVHTLMVGGLTPAFWRAREELAPLFPRGIDLVLCCGDRLAALPRTTQLQWEP
jgi:alpha-D-ribose 1-methylphosphonate 5-triphosphate synthase subunit PhnH